MYIDMIFSGNAHIAKLEIVKYVTRFTESTAC